MPHGLVDTAYREIRSKIVSGEYPLGARLSNRALAKDVNMSLTPVREALSRLISEGLLGYQPGIGVFVPIPTEKEIDDQYELRSLLECGNVAKIVGTLSSSFFHKLERPMATIVSVVEQIRHGPPGIVIEEGLFAQWREADGEFHKTLLQAGNNHQIIRLLDNLRLLIRIQQRSDYENMPEILEATHQQHIDLVNALKTGDRDNACRVMKEHVVMSHTHAKEAYRRHYLEHSEFETFYFSNNHDTAVPVVEAS